jgi:molybdopterin molybdotransferase
MITAAEAEAIVLDCMEPPAASDAEQVDLPQADGRVLASVVHSQLDFPHWDNSAMDGYAVRYADVQAIAEQSPVTLTVVEDIPAGQLPQTRIQPGQAARIMTGSMMPEGADTVVMQEVTQRTSDRLTIFAAPQPQQFVRQRAAFYQAGDPLLPSGTYLGGPEIAVLAAAQITTVTVYRRPRVAILSTGSELVSPDHPLQPGQIVDSNQYALAALVRQTGAEPICLGIVPDDPAALKTAIGEAQQQSDLILSSGGVSVGDYDYVDRILTELGATVAVRSVAVKPGKPLTVATLKATGEAKDLLNGVPRTTLYFGLPGNPVSALVSFWRFVEPAIRKRSGLPHSWSPQFVPAIADAPLASGGNRETYLWGKLRLTETGYRFALSGGSHSSGNLVNLAGTNGLAIVPIGETVIPAGASVQVMQIERSLTLPLSIC